MSWRQRLQSFSWQRVDRLAPIVLALLIVLLCWRLASLFWWLVAPPQFFNSTRVVLGSQQEAIPTINNFSLFYEQSQGQQTGVLDNAQLQGVMVAVPQRNSSAVIKVNDIAERYRVGDVIGQSQYQLAAVHWDHVVLTQGNAAPKVLKFSGIDNLDQPLDEDSRATATSQPATISSKNNNALGQAIEQLNQNQAEYLQQMGLSRREEGYEVSAQTPEALRQKMGLIAGDRILSINGQKIGQGANDVQLLEQAKRAGKIKIDVKRGEQVLSFEQDL